MLNSHFNFFRATRSSNVIMFKEQKSKNSKFFVCIFSKDLFFCILSEQRLKTNYKQTQ